MSKEQGDETKLKLLERFLSRLLSGLVAAGSLVAALSLAKLGLEMAGATTTPGLIRDHAPAVFGVPILAALAAAIVCGARALESYARVELLGLQGEGAGAAVLSWAIVFAALAIALRALW